MRNDFYTLPSDLPIPLDDGACVHLTGLKMPNISLSSTANRLVNLLMTSQNATVFFCYPRTGRPDEPSPVGWNEVPGARGCTPQSCGYRDHFAEFQKLGVKVFGVSTQTTSYQQEFVQRIKLPFEILSDSDFTLTNFLGLPTFSYNSMRLLKRMAVFTDLGRIKKVFYPVFPPDKNAEEVLSWLIKKLKEGGASD